MFEREIMLNRFLLGYFDRVVSDLTDEDMTVRSIDSGHPPVWILGHLGACVGLCDKYLGNQLEHPDWLELFGPGSSDDVADAEDYSRELLVSTITNGYPRVCNDVKNAADELFTKPHGLGLLDGSPMKTSGDLIAHLLSTHFSFHLAQLSACRQAKGHSALF